MSQSFVLFASPAKHVHVRQSAHGEENAHVRVPFLVHVLQFLELQPQEVIFVGKRTGTVQSDFLVAFNFVDEGLVADVLKVGVDAAAEKNLVVVEVRGEHEIVRGMGKLVVQMRGLQLLRFFEDDVVGLVFRVALHSAAARGDCLELELLEVERYNFAFVSGLSEKKDFSFLDGGQALVDEGRGLVGLLF